jgi:hypothetical protein
MHERSAILKITAPYEHMYDGGTITNKTANIVEKVPAQTNIQQCESVEFVNFTRIFCTKNVPVASIKGEKFAWKIERRRSNMCKSSVCRYTHIYGTYTCVVH